MKYKEIYVFTVVFITFVIFLLYCVSIHEHKKEMSKIYLLENVNNEKVNQINKARENSIPCIYGKFHNPKSCYNDSGRRCSWNIMGERCDLK